MKQSTLSHKQPFHPPTSRAACLAPSPWGFSLVFTAPILVHFSLSKSRCSLIQRQGGMLKWPKCQVDYTVGEGRGKTHTEYMRNERVRTWQGPWCSARHLRASPLSLALLATERPASDSNTVLDFFLFPTPRKQTQYFYHQDNWFSNNW